MSTHTTGDLQTLATDDPLTVERTPLPGDTVLAGRYRIRELIGEGGMGDVYLAEHLKIGKAVAIKVLAPQQMRRPRTVSRFLQEAKAASMIRHQNVVDITDYGESDGCAFFVMEYLRGEDLSFVLKREGRLPWSRIKPICTQVLAALGAAHAAGIVHRDIKPHNCFVTPREGGLDHVTVIDFGIAKLSESSEEQLTRTGAIMGTAEYMSPEQGLGSELDGRSDLYSVGVILYRMLTGSVPYKGSNPMAILYQHIHGERVPPSVACPEAGIGPQVDALVLKALAKDRDDRFASADEFIAALEAIDDAAATGVTVEAERRRLGPWLAVGAIAMVLALGGAAVAVLGGGDTGPSAMASGAAGSLDPSPASPLAPASLPPPAAGDGADAPAPSGDGDAIDEVAVGSVDAKAPADADADQDADDSADVDPDADAPGVDAALEPEAPDASTEPGEPSRPARRPTREVHGRLARIDAKVRACGKKAGLFPGESVTVRLDIAPNGRVRTAKVIGAFSRKGAACIEKAVRSTRFSTARLAQTAEHRFTL